jgi:hypothetical protein
MVIPLAAFIPAFQDDTDVLVNAVRSLVAVPGLREILICDTGPGFYHENFRTDQRTVKEFCAWACAEGWPVSYDAGHTLAGCQDFSVVRNYANAVLGDYPWIIHLDSDEVVTCELARDLQALLKSVASDVVTIAPRLLSLFPDEQTYAVLYSNLLTHGRIYRPKFITWENPRHEHQHYRGARYEWADHCIVHCRPLFERRCQRQCGHGAAAWPSFVENLRPLENLGVPVSWPPLEWPGEEHHNE